MDKGTRVLECSMNGKHENICNIVIRKAEGISLLWCHKYKNIIKISLKQKWCEHEDWINVRKDDA
jgi:hypothetical protein